MSAKPQTSASSPAAAVLKITQIGNSVGVILPKDVLVTLRPYDDTFEHQMALARDIMKEYREVLRELAK